jgi:hypothetical protein
MTDQTKTGLAAGLLPCPFCNHPTPHFEREGTRRQSCIVVCGNCGCRHESSDVGHLNGSSWNERAAPAVAVNAEAMEPTGPAFIGIGADDKTISACVMRHMPDGVLMVEESVQEPIKSAIKGLADALARVTRSAESAQPAKQRACAAEGCGWSGQTDRMCGSVGPLCPRCGETTELDTPAVAVSAEAVRNAALEEAAHWVQKRADDYDADHGTTDPDTGTREYPYEGAEYVQELEEISDAIRALKSAPPAESAQPNYQGMFRAAVASLAEISAALGIAIDEAACANGNALILDAVGALKAAAAVTGPTRRELDLAMAVRRFVSSARRNCEDGSNVLKLANEAWSLLVRHGMEGSPLRDAGIESDPAAQPAQQSEPAHSDDAAVDAFSAAMKQKLAQARENGRNGWQECDPAALSCMLREHVEKGDLNAKRNPAAPQAAQAAPVSAPPPSKDRIDLCYIIHDMVVAQQAAWIEWQHGEGAEAAMRWIHNGLCGPGHIPDEDAPYGKEPQAYFDANKSDPFPPCTCGRPSNTLWMGQGFCCDEHYREAKALAASKQGGNHG